MEKSASNPVPMSVSKDLSSGRTWASYAPGAFKSQLRPAVPYSWSEWARDSGDSTRGVAEIAAKTPIVPFVIAARAADRSGVLKYPKMAIRAMSDEVGRTIDDVGEVADRLVAPLNALPGPDIRFSREDRGESGQDVPAGVEIASRMKKSSEAPMVKSSLATGMIPRSKESMTAEGYANARVFRGIGRGAAHAAPELIDFVVGVPSGILNGAGHALAGNGFAHGWNMSRDFTRDYISSPLLSSIRWATTSLKNGADAMVDNRRKALKQYIGDAGLKDADQYVDTMERIGGFGGSVIGQGGILGWLSKFNKVNQVTKAMNAAKIQHTAAQAQKVRGAEAKLTEAWKAAKQSVGKRNSAKFRDVSKANRELGLARKRLREKTLEVEEKFKAPLESARKVDRRVGRAAGATVVSYPAVAVADEKLREYGNADKIAAGGIDDLVKMDPGSQDYANRYAILEALRGQMPANLQDKFDKLAKPTYVQSQDGDGGSTAGGGAPSAPAPQNDMTWADWYAGLPDWNKRALVGAGGAGIGSLLGLIFGGKGGWWRWALLGALLGSMGGGSGVGGIYDRLAGNGDA